MLGDRMCMLCVITPRYRRPGTRGPVRGPLGDQDRLRYIADRLTNRVNRFAQIGH
jgi:hypothetical protein